MVTPRPSNVSFSLGFFHGHQRPASKRPWWVNNSSYMAAHLEAQGFGTAHGFGYGSPPKPSRDVLE
jgi:hypothetical protein